MVGLLPRVEDRVASYFDSPRDEVFILGETSGILGGSAYWAEVCDFVGGDAPAVDLEAELRLQRFLVAAAEQQLLRSAHDCSEGGLAVALAEAVIGGPYVPGSLGAEPRPDRLRARRARGRAALRRGRGPGGGVLRARHRPGPLIALANEHGVPVFHAGRVESAGTPGTPGGASAVLLEHRSPPTDLL